MSGPRRDGSPWIIDIESPNACDDIARIEIACGGVATSGRDHRRWQGGHHIIDPRTGRPANTDVLRATVVAHSALDAEVLAKLVVLLGMEDGLALIDARGNDVAAFVIAENGDAHESRSFRHFRAPTRPAAFVRRST